MTTSQRVAHVIVDGEDLEIQVNLNPIDVDGDLRPGELRLCDDCDLVVARAYGDGVISYKGSDWRPHLHEEDTGMTQCLPCFMFSLRKEFVQGIISPGQLQQLQPKGRHAA